jgi:GGDEF domain-containing protein
VLDGMELRLVASVDSLTGVMTRRAFIDAAGAMSPARCATAAI